MNKNIFIRQLKKLISLETVTGNIEENSKTLDYIVSIIDSKAKIKRIKNKNAEILIAGNTDVLNPDFCYMVHVDVVAAKSEQFKMKQKGDKLFGRGVSDMKFSIPLGIDVLNNLVKNEDIKFTFVATTDEEIGGFEGAKYLSENLKFKPKCLIVPDGGDNLNFVEKAKGVCQILIESTGKPAHASRPWMGKNAIDPLIKLASELIKKYGKNSIEENWNTTLNIGQIEGGISTNQVCSSAIMKLDFRYPETDSIERISTEVKDLALKIDKDLKISLMSTGLPTFTNINDPIVKKFIESMEKVFESKIKIDRTFGASDARHFSKLNIPVLMFKPIGGEIHSDNEWVSLSSCMKFFEGLKMFFGLDD